MTKKIAFAFAILWLAFPFLLLAQAPADGRTVPASAVSEENRPCWERVVKTMAEGSACFGSFTKELKKQKDSPATLEELEIAGVRFLKTNGYTDEEAASLVANQIKKLSPATETPEPTKPAEVKSTPAVSEETPRQMELVDRTASPVVHSLESRRTDGEDRPRQKGWKAGLPRPEEKSGHCWEGRTNPGDLADCIAQLEQYINQVREDKSLPSEGRQLAVKNLKIYLKMLEELQKSVKKGLNTQRTWATSRSNSMLRGCTDTWVHEEFAGPGSRYFDRASVNIYNNTGGEIREIKISDRGTVVERLCAGGSLILHRHLEGQPYGVNFSFVAEALVFEGGVQKVYVWELPASIYRNSMNQAPVTWTLTKDNRRMY